MISSAVMPQVSAARCGVHSAARCLELVEAERVPGDVVVVDQVLGDQHVHHAKRQRGVGAGHQRDVLVALLGRQRAVWVDRDQLRAAPLGFLRARPEMQVRGDRIAAPDDDQLRILELFEVGADGGADGVLVAGGAGHRADGAVEQRGAEVVEEARRHRLALHQSHGAAIAVRQDRLRRAAGDIAQLIGDLAKRFVPADALELALAFFADAAHRMQQAFRMVGAFGVARDLGAQHAGGGRMVGIAFDFGGDAVLDGDQQRAGIGAVMRAGRAHLLSGHRRGRKTK